MDHLGFCCSCLNLYVDLKILLGRSHILHIEPIREHLLQHCQLNDALRQDMWPEPKPLRDKHCGNLEELKRTAVLMRAMGISV